MKAVDGIAPAYIQAQRRRIPLGIPGNCLEPRNCFGAPGHGGGPLEPTHYLESPLSKRWTSTATHPSCVAWPTLVGLPPSRRASKGRSAKSQLFSVLGPQWRNELPADVRIAESLTSFRKRLKTHLFRVHVKCKCVNLWMLVMTDNTLLNVCLAFWY